jgi:hypothetical protein
MLIVFTNLLIIFSQFIANLEKLKRMQTSGLNMPLAWKRPSHINSQTLEILFLVRRHPRNAEEKRKIKEKSLRNQMQAKRRVESPNPISSDLRAVKLNLEVLVRI